VARSAISETSLSPVRKTLPTPLIHWVGCLEKRKNHNQFALEEQNLGLFFPRSS
jgi:hypothetical protein